MKREKKGSISGPPAFAASEKVIWDELHQKFGNNVAAI